MYQLCADRLRSPLPQEGGFEKCRNDSAATPPHCHFDGWQWSGEISFHDSYKLHCVIAVGDFGAQSLNRTKDIVIHHHMQYRSK